MSVHAEFSSFSEAEMPSWRNLPVVREGRERAGVPAAPSPTGAPCTPAASPKHFNVQSGGRGTRAMLEGAVDFQVSVAGWLCLGKLGASSGFLATLMG